MAKREVKPELSVIIALYNQEKEIKICLDSVFNSDWKQFEVIIIDDCSTDSSLNAIKNYPCRIFSTGKNSGPAKARNIGVREAKAKIVLFLDADTKVEKDSLKNIHHTFIQQPETWGVIALPNINSLRKGRASNYNALKNYYTLYSADSYCNYFTTQMGAIRKDIFKKVGGFDENFKGADIEDMEFGMRMADRKIFINKKVIISHHFPDFKSILKKYFRRSIMMMELVRAKKKMNSAHASPGRTALVMLVLINFFLLLFLWVNPLASFLFMLTFFLFLLFNFNLFSFAVQKRGAWYIFQSIFFEYLFSMAIGIGGIVSVVQSPIKRLSKIGDKRI